MVIQIQICITDVVIQIQISEINFNMPWFISHLMLMCLHGVVTSPYIIVSMEYFI